jgi:UDP-N-acetylglucosamine acyltransferase
VVDIRPGEAAVGAKLVGANDPYFAGHFPGTPVFPGILLCESVAQLAGLALREADLTVLRVSRARFRRPALPGDVLDIAVTVQPGVKPWRVHGEVTCAGMPVAELDVVLDQARGTRVHPTAIVARSAELGPDVHVGPFAVVGPEVVVGTGTWIGAHAVVMGRTRLGARNRVFPFAAVGTQPQDLKFRGEPSRLELGDDNSIREHASVHTGTEVGGMVTRIGNGCLLMVSAHIGHDSTLGDSIVIAAGAAIGGHVMIQDFAIIGGLVGVHQFARIGESALCAAGSMVSADVPPYCTVAGDRARLHGLNTIGLRRRGFSSEALRTLKRAYRLLFLAGGSRDDAVVRTRAAFPDSFEVARLTQFVAESTRGVCR